MNCATNIHVKCTCTILFLLLQQFSRGKNFLITIQRDFDAIMFTKVFWSTLSTENEWRLSKSSLLNINSRPVCIVHYSHICQFLHESSSLTHAKNPATLGLILQPFWVAGLAPVFLRFLLTMCCYLFTLLARERHCKGKLSFSSLQYIDPSRAWLQTLFRASLTKQCNMCLQVSVWINVSITNIIIYKYFPQ